MKRMRKAAPIAMIIGLNLAVIGPGRIPAALAASPEFARTAGEWETLRDDRLEVKEIADLIHEYNNQVIQDQISYREYKGENQDKISQDYYDAAEEIENRITDPDPEEAGYAGAVSAALNSRIQAENLRKQGDDNIEDGEIKRLGYLQTEAKLVKEAQERMIDYWTQTWQLQQTRTAWEEAKAALKSEEIKVQAGLSTRENLLSAQGKEQEAKAEIETAQSTLDLTRQQLCLMLGWPYGAQVEICQVPEADPEAVGRINLSEDVAKALDSSYDLKITGRRLENARSSSARSSQEQTLKNQREAAAGSVREAYDQLLLAKTNYESAIRSMSTAENAYGSAQRKAQAGLLAARELETEKQSWEKANFEKQSAGLALLKAQIQYQWTVDGLASVT